MTRFSREAYRIRSGLGGANVALTLIRGIRSGVVKDVDENWDTVEELLVNSVQTLHAEAKLIEAGESPSIRCDEQAPE